MPAFLLPKNKIRKDYFKMLDKKIVRVKEEIRQNKDKKNRLMQEAKTLNRNVVVNLSAISSAISKTWSPVL